jgi:xanthine dehydrogenase accessory factor
LFKEICRLAAAGESIAVAVVFNKIGSAPRMAGARMIVHADGSIMGSIGGGILEAHTLQMAKEVFESRKPSARKFSLSDQDAEPMGMSCGGQVEILAHLVDASDVVHLLLYRSIAAELVAGRKASLITRIPSGRDDIKALGQCLVKHDGSAIGTLGCDSLGMREHLSSTRGYQPRCIELRGERFLIEPLCNEGVVYIFGAGHIGQNLATLTAMVGFPTVVVDDREELVGDRRFESADRIIPDSFEQAMDGLEVHQHSYIVIVTRGHRHDKTVLAQALKTQAGYIGMIGSRRKRESIYGALASEGFTTEDLARVHCPVGLPIGAQTPEEIALSIVAELIQAKYARKSV